MFFVCGLSQNLRIIFSWKIIGFYILLFSSHKFFPIFYHLCFLFPSGHLFIKHKPLGTSPVTRWVLLWILRSATGEVLLLAVQRWNNARSLPLYPFVHRNYSFLACCGLFSLGPSGMEGTGGTSRPRVGPTFRYLSWWRPSKHTLYSFIRTESSLGKISLRRFKHQNKTQVNRQLSCEQSYR